MNKIDHLILTIDYEVFGNGSGCPIKCVIEPAERILATATRYSAPVTLFVEALEFMAMEQATTTMAQGEAAKAQIRAAVKEGHDAQLHLHPQWANATRHRDGTWALDMTKWRTGDLKTEEIQQLLTVGKQWLNTLLRPVKSDYTCHTFRAGGWCIQPSAGVLEALAALGFRIDSTVAPRLGNAAPGDWYDFRGTPDKPYWRVADDVCTESRVGIWEVPITVSRVSRTAHMLSLLDKKRSKASELAPECVGSYAGPNSAFQSLLGKLSKLATTGYVMLDISTMPAPLLISAVKHWRDVFTYFHKPLPIVAIGHTKNFASTSEAELGAFLEWAATQEKLIFSTYGEWLETSDDS